jgi:hypothetical protein
MRGEATVPGVGWHVGAPAALGFVSRGWLLLLPAFVVALGIGEYAHPPGFTRLGLISGVGLLLLVVAYINRDGPFDTHRWGAAGTLFLVAGIAAFVVAGRRVP